MLRCIFLGRRSLAMGFICRLRCGCDIVLEGDVVDAGLCSTVNVTVRVNMTILCPGSSNRYLYDELAVIC